MPDLSSVGTDDLSWLHKVDLLDCVTWAATRGLRTLMAKVSNMAGKSKVKRDG